MRRALVTGSSGLVGGETVRLLCDNGFKVFGLDNNLRHRFVGEEANTELQRQSLDHELLSFAPLAADIRGTEAVEQLFRYYGPFDLIVHSAAQPAHGWATDHPLEDFQITAFGTLVLLENYRRWSPDAVFIQVSSSRVYGSPIADLPVQELDTRYDLPADHRFFEGIDESIGLDHSTRSLFGVSKTSGDLAASARPSSGRPIPPGSLSTTTTRSSESCAGTGWTPTPPATSRCLSLCRQWRGSWTRHRPSR